MARVSHRTNGLRDSGRSAELEFGFLPCVTDAWRHTLQSDVPEASRLERTVTAGKSILSKCVKAV